MLPLGKFTWVGNKFPNDKDMPLELCYPFNYNADIFNRGTRWRRWLRHYATRRKVAGSILDVIGFFNWPNSSSRTMALGSTRPLTEMSTRNLSGVKGGRRHLWADCLENVGASTSQNPMGLHGLLRDSFNFTFYIFNINTPSCRRYFTNLVPI
jgi:hypothetical protein